MPNTPTEDIQVENETVEPYRGVMIFRTLQRGVIVGLDGEKSKRSFGPQTFYALLDKKQLPEGSNAETLLVGTDVENVRALIDQSVPGTGLITARQQDSAKAAA
jgi:hypothetical protein